MWLTDTLRFTSIINLLQRCDIGLEGDAVGDNLGDVVGNIPDHDGDVYVGATCGKILDLQKFQPKFRCGHVCKQFSAQL